MGTEASLFYIVTVLETGVNLLSYILVGSCFYICIAYPLFHINFTRLVKCMFVFYIISQILRLITSFNEIFGFFPNHFLFGDFDIVRMLSVIRSFCLISAYSATGTVTLERTYATIKLKTYETSVSNALFIFCFGYQIFAGCVGTYGIYTGRITLLYGGIFVLTANFIGCCWLYCLEIINKKRYYISLIKPKIYSLSERYQLQENVRTAKMIKHVATLVCILNLFLGALICLMNYYNTETIKNVAFAVFQFSLSVYGNGFAIMGITSNPLWLHQFKRIFSLSNRLKISPVDQSVTQKRIRLGKQLLTYNGKQMVFSINEERELYFSQLQTQW